MLEVVRELAALPNVDIQVIPHDLGGEQVRVYDVVFDNLRGTQPGADNGAGVELTWSDGRAFARDSKNPSGPLIPVDLPALVGTMKAGRFHR